MALSADRNRNSHLLACEFFLKPTIAMTTTWNQVVLRGAVFYRALAKLAGLNSVFGHFYLPAAGSYLPKRNRSFCPNWKASLL